MSAAAAAELAPGLWRWTARHPEWHPGAFGAEVASYGAATPDGALLLIDPLLPEDGGESRREVQDRLDTLAAAARSVAILITIPYHVRSAELLHDRYSAPIHGPAKVAGRLSGAARAFSPLTPDVPGPGGVRAFAIGRPRRNELPLWLPSHRAVAFGDALVTTPAGELRVWTQQPVTDRWYRERFVPTFAALRELPIERVLSTHGAAILADGSAALAAALDAPPWHHRG
jgi:hypothetical protein